MQNIYEKIDMMFSGQNDDRPLWAVEILDEIKELKELVKQTQTIQKNTNSKEFYDFVNHFRNSMKANIEKDEYPNFEYHGKNLGVNFQGFLYEKESRKILSKEIAFEVYNYAYKQSLNTV